MSKGRLAGRRALVTGAAEGIGAAIAGRFAGEGAKVLLSGRRIDAGSRAAAQIRLDGGDAQFFAADLSDEAAVRTLVDACSAQLGGLDILVNNAAIAPAGPLELMRKEAWDEALACNLTSMFLTTKWALPLLRRSEGASIINVASTYGLVGAAGAVAYAMTKAGAVSMSKSLALELAIDGIRVNALCPGATRTQMMEKWASDSPDGYEATVAASIERHPIGRLGTPEEQAAAALFLASDDASFVTGHALLVDGGYTAQ